MIIRAGRLLLTDVLFACHFYVFVIGCIFDNMLGAATFNKSDLPALESGRRDSAIVNSIVDAHDSFTGKSIAESRHVGTVGHHDVGKLSVTVFICNLKFGQGVIDSTRSEAVRLRESVLYQLACFVELTHVEVDSVQKTRPDFIYWL
jgi:hypothetical protein